MRLNAYRQLTLLIKALIWASAWTILYLVLVVTLPPNIATMRDYNLSGGEFRILSLLSGLPIVMVWFVTFFGYAALASYAAKVGISREGRAFTGIAIGLKWLAWGLPISTCINTVLGGITRLNPQFFSASLIISHYVYLIISLIAFTYMSTGTRVLRDVIGKLPSKLSIRIMMASIIVLSVAYCATTINIVKDQHPSVYRLPMWLILLTIIVPYLYAWMMGFFAVFEISEYRRSVRGHFYKQALGLLATGSTFAIAASVALQYLTSSSPSLRRIDLNWRFVATYIIVVTFAIGYLMIALGANKLKKIEEV